MSSPLPHPEIPGDLHGLRVVFLNGPPGSGKDTAAKALRRHFPSSIEAKFARRLKESVHADFGAPALPHGFFENCKEQPHDFFFGKTPRQAYIDKSELMIKPVYGKDFFGRVLRRDLAAEVPRGVEIAFISDSGFADEAWPVIDALKTPEDALLVRIEASGRGKSFKGDSRGYLDLPGISTCVVRNDGIQVDFEKSVTELVSAWALLRPPVPRARTIRRALFFLWRN